jgi:hypothetical protein
MVLRMGSMAFGFEGYLDMHGGFLRVHLGCWLQIG